MQKQLVGLAAIGLLATWAVGMETPVFAEEAAQRAFVGVGKCKTCHKTEAQGEQYGKWMESAHAKAYETLASDEAKALGKEKGIEDPQKSDECLSCHVTAHGVAAELLGTKYAVTDGVGCESCHGAGADYYKKKTMIAILTGEIEAESVGLVIPTEETCKTCHNEKSPSFKGFKFDEMKAKIAHPIPEERKAAHKE